MTGSDLGPKKKVAKMMLMPNLCLMKNVAATQLSGMDAHHETWTILQALGGMVVAVVGKSVPHLRGSLFSGTNMVLRVNFEAMNLAAEVDAVSLKIWPSNLLQGHHLFGLVYPKIQV